MLAVQETKFIFIFVLIRANQALREVNKPSCQLPRKRESANVVNTVTCDLAFLRI
jgi:hypothetical protein